MYEYKATVLKIVDGDTVDIEIDLGFDIRTVQRVRMAGINAAEHNTAAGQEAITWMKARLQIGQPVTIQSEKPGGGDKYGRYLATIIDGTGNVNQSIVAAGHALPWDGQGVKPV